MTPVQLELSPPFSFHDWMADVQWVAACIDDPERFHHSTIEAYFERKYGAQSGPRGRRVFGAIKYFMNHREDFNEGSLGIDSEAGFVPGTLLLKALLVLFNGAGEDQLAKDWPVEIVRTIARQLEARKS